MSNTLPRFVPNRGQFHPGVAGVWNVPAAICPAGEYRGAGPVLVTTNMRRELVRFEYLPVDGDGAPVEIREAANAEEPGLFVLPAMASCYEICVDAGTRAAALLTALGEPEDGAGHDD